MQQKHPELTNSSYSNLFRIKIMERFNKEYSPGLMIDIWQEVFESCEHAYADSIFELDNELSIRDDIEFALNEPDLMQCPEHKIFVNKVEQIDSDFKKIIQPTSDSNKLWWKNLVLKYASDEYVEQMKLYKNIIVEKIE